MRNGFTLPELLSVAAVVGVLTSIAIPPLRRELDRAAVREGVEQFASAHAATRQLAISKNRLARLDLDPVRRTATLALQRPDRGWDTVTAYPLGTATIVCSNPTLIFGPTGLGFGASNTRVVFARGASADTVTTSRTGRLRR